MAQTREAAREGTVEASLDLDHLPERGDGPKPVRVTPRANWGRVLGPVVAVVTYALLPSGDGGLSSGGRATIAIGLLMAVWWVTEALPLAATALLPLALFPITGVLSIDDAASPYANDLIFLFMGGFMLALAMQRWGLHRRIALVTVRTAGMKPTRMVGGFNAGDRWHQHVGVQHRHDRDDAPDRAVDPDARVR